MIKLFTNKKKLYFRAYKKTSMTVMGEYILSLKVLDFNIPSYYMLFYAYLFISQGYDSGGEIYKEFCARNKYFASYYWKSSSDFKQMVIR